MTTLPPAVRASYAALRTLPDGRVAGVMRSDDGYTLECGEVRRTYGCVLDALHALGTWGGRHNYAGVPDVSDLPALGIEDLPIQNTAPDGKPWRKCCEECQYRDKPSIPLVEADCAERGAAFYCVHREDDTGHYRVCAGFAARDTGRRRDPDTGEVWHERDDARRARRMVGVTG